MNEVSTVAFLSYAHEDDRLDDGNVRKLADRLASEYSLMTGQDLGLFVDRTSIEWGDEWRRRIDGALTTTSFFIPVITPRFFTRIECRREAIAFHRGAQSLGIAELLLPILYLPVPDLREDNPDEVIALISRYQYADWTDHRLVDAGSSQYRRALNALAVRLADASTTVTNRQLIVEVARAAGATENDDLGLLDLLEKINGLLPDWLEALESTEVNEAQFDAMWQIYSTRLANLEQSPGMGGAKLALMRRIAQEEMPMAERFTRDATKYARKCVELDPIIAQAIRIADGDSSAVSELRELRATLVRAERNIRRDQDRAKRKDQTAYDWARSRAHLSQLVRKLAGIWLEGEKAVEEGNELVIRWLANLDGLLGDASKDEPESVP